VPHLPFPNLAQAMGETAASVLERTWSWKDDLHFAQQLYYGKIIAGQPSFLAPDYLPDFIAALAGRGMEHERDATGLYFDGRLSSEAKAIYDWLLDHPAQPTRELRRGTRLGDTSKKLATERALVELQSGSDGSHARHVLLRLGLAERFWPQVFVDASHTSPTAARSNIRGQLREFGLAPSPQLEQRLFLWT
jgi:hypothetical protein